MSDEDKALVPATTAPLPARQQMKMSRADVIATEMDPDRAVEQIKAAGKAFDKLRDYALTLTDSRCWDNMQGRPRLNAYGAHKIAKAIGLRVRTYQSMEIDSGKDARGEYFIFQCTGEISHPLSPAVISCQGTCDSRNKFHTTRYEDVLDDKGNLIWEEKRIKDKRTGKFINKRLPKREKIELQAHQVQRAFIAQQAHTLCKTKGVAEYLQLDRLSWDEVEKATEARMEEAASVTFQDKSDKTSKLKAPGPAAPPAEPAPRTGDEMANPRERSAVWRAFVERMGWESSVPESGAQVFYGFVEGLLGDAGKRDKTTWTVKDVHAMLRELEEGGTGEPPPPNDSDGLP